MKLAIFLVVGIVTFYHVIRLILDLLLSKFLVFSKMGLMRVCFNPERGKKTVATTLKNILRHGVWTAAGCLTMFLMMPHYRFSVA